MCAEDAEIVQRIRARCPDNRFDGGSDDELIQLVQGNKRVLNRSDEDVIAAMMHLRLAAALSPLNGRPAR